VDVKTIAFEQIYRDCYRTILTVAHQRLGGFDAAEDATADVFRVAWTHYKAGTEINLPWLYQTLRNIIGNEYRHRSRTHALDDKIMLNWTDSEFDNVDPLNEVLTVRAAIHELSQPERELVYMFYWEDLSAPEIAAILKTTQTAVRLRLMRARTNLKHILSNGLSVRKESTDEETKSRTAHPSRAPTEWEQNPAVIQARRG